ncbi:MAG: circadian clock protein KaiC [Planctomycetaceae bacterium]|nr:circadian clock protein KaiC [Planctomycetaceae bacterium]
MDRAIDQGSNEFHLSEIEAQAPALISSGDDRLDYVLGGGFAKNCTILIEGDPGAGKTTLALTFALEGVRKGGSCLYICLSESEEDLKAVADSHGLSLEGLHIADLSPGSEALNENTTTMFHPSDVELSELTTAITNAFEQHSPTRVVIDSLGELRHLSQSELRYRRQLIALKSYFRSKECTVLFIDDRKEIADLQLQSVARGTIELQKSTPNYGRIRRRLQVSKMRGQRVRTGFHEFTIERGGLQIYPRLVAAEHQRTFEPGMLTSGIAELDSLLSGGLRYGTSTLITGAAGTGKSSLTAQYAHAAIQQGGAAAIYAFDETAGNYITRSEGLGIPIGADRESGKLVLKQVDSAELSPAEFAWHARRAVEELNCRVVVIDSLNGYLHAMPDEHYLRGQLHELLSYFSQLGVCTLITLSQHGLIGTDVESPVETSYLADANILLRYFEHSGRVRKAISVVKKRAGGHEASIRELALSSNGIRISEPLDDFQGVLAGVPEYLGTHDPLI